jgi:hypothetical protein
MGINKPIVPARLFTNEGEALNWLKKFRKGLMATEQIKYAR